MTRTASPPARASDLSTRFAAALVMIAVAVVATYASGWPFRILAALAAAVMLLEWGDMHRVKRLWTWIAITLVVALLLVGTERLYPAAFSNPTFIASGSLEEARIGFAGVGAIALTMGLAGRSVALGWGVLYIGIPAFALVALNWAWAELVLWLFLVVWATDIFAYFAGRAIGGAKLAPRISPNKTWAGLIGGVIGAGAVGWVGAWLMEVDPLFFWLGAPMAVLAQLGDLYESSVKRRHGVKDSGTLLPGHGGVLDRLDGLLPAALATFVALLLLSRAV
jgi:phosphatidate cytidylyltransferase